MLGIESDAPYFEKVKIEPHLGKLNNIGGEIPHPNGKIKVSYDLTGSGLNAEISLPEGISGRFIWKGESHELRSGSNLIQL
jgi:hypothetical protein